MTFKHNQKGFSHHLLLPIIVIAVVAVIGTYVLSQSHAASNAYVAFDNYANAGSTPGVTTSIDNIPDLGSETVSNIQPNSKLVYTSFPGKVDTAQNCYYLRVYNNPKASVQVTSAKIQIAAYGNAKTVTVPADTNYHKVCVSSGTGAQLPYNVDNLSGSAYVLVYQEISEY